MSDPLHWHNDAVAVCIATAFILFVLYAANKGWI